MDGNKAYLAPKEVAEMLALSQQTILRLYRAGILPGIPVTIGKRKSTIRFHKPTIEKWLEKRSKLDRYKYVDRSMS